MGCVNERNRTAGKDHSARSCSDIDQDNDAKSITHCKELAGHACGYQFDINVQEIAQSIRDKKMAAEAIKYSRLQSLCLQMNAAYEEHKIDQCDKIIDDIVRSKREIDFHLITEDTRQLQETVRNRVQEIQEEYRDMLAFEAEIDKGGWVFKSQNKGTRISSRREQGTVGVLVQATIDVPLEIFLSVVSEVNLMKNFMPFMEQSSCEKQLSRNNKIGFCRLNFPILSKRDAFFQGIGYNRLQFNDTVFLYTRSIHNRPDLCTKFGYQPQINKDYVLMDYKYMIVKYQPLSGGKGKVTLAMNVDLKLSFVPISILDFTCQNFGENFFDNLMKISRNFEGSPWEKSVQNSPGLFDFFKRIIEEYHQSKKKL